MKKILMIICCAFAVLSASAQDKKLTLNAGFLFPNTLNDWLRASVELWQCRGNLW